MKKKHFFLDKNILCTNLILDSEFPSNRTDSQFRCCLDGMLVHNSVTCTK